MAEVAIRLVEASNPLGSLAAGLVYDDATGNILRTWVRSTGRNLPKVFFQRAEDETDREEVVVKRDQETDISTRAWKMETRHGDVAPPLLNVQVAYRG